MARVTVEDCIDKIPNRFDVVMLAAHRARALDNGAQMLVARDDDKYPVIALREIADEKLTPKALREAAIESMQKHLEVDEPVEDGMSARMGEVDAPAENDMSEEAFLRALKGA